MNAGSVSGSVGRRIALLIGGWVALVASLLSERAFAAESHIKRQCAAAYEQAQVLKVEGDLLGATERLVYCGGASCPHVMHADCNRWLHEVQASMPTVVFRAIAPDGAEIEAATVSVDGGPESALTGRAMDVNAGEHEVVLRAPGYNPLSTHLKFIEGQKLRLLALTLTPDSATADSSSSKDMATAEHAATASPSRPAGRRWTLAQWIPGGIGLAGGLGFAYFGLEARSEEHALARCTPSCTKQSVSAAKSRYLLANLSLGVGVVGTAVAAIHYWTQPTVPQLSSSRLELSVGPREFHLRGSF